MEGLCEVESQVVLAAATQARWQRELTRAIPSWGAGWRDKTWGVGKERRCQTGQFHGDICPENCKFSPTGLFLLAK